MGTWGGARTGAGRKKAADTHPEAISTLPSQTPKVARKSGPKIGSGRYGERTLPLRIPESLKSEVLQYVENKGFNLPVFATKVPMGFASPADDYIERRLNLNELIKHPAVTYFHPMDGRSMEPILFAGDLAMIDAAIQPQNRDVVLAFCQGGLTVKRYFKRRDGIWLVPDNAEFQEFKLTEDCRICGVMLYAIRPTSPNHTKKF